MVSIVKNISKIYYFIFIMWILALLDILFPFINHFGIKPRTVEGLIGIPLSIFLHANLSINPFHLINNSLLLIILLPIFHFFYQKTTQYIIYWIILLSGTLVWIFGRSYNHIGSSSLIFGMILFLLFSGVFRKNLHSILAAILLIITYGIIIYGIFPLSINDFLNIFKYFAYNIYSGIFPQSKEISWEGHLFGSLSGIFTAYYFRNSKN